MAISKTDWLNGPTYGYDEARRYEYEREMHYRRQEEEYRRMQNMYCSPQQQQAKLVNTAPKPDLKDPLAFLQNTDKKLLLTGEMQ